MYKNHQTIVFVRDGANEERAERFVSSLNRAGDSGTIKADVVTVRADGQLIDGLHLGDEISDALSDEELKEIADNKGYNLTVIVS